MDYYLALGYIAGFLTTFAILPQIIKVYRTKSTEDLAYSWAVMVTVGYALWLSYGIGLASYPLIGYNIISIILMLLLIGLKIKYERKASRKSKQI